MCNKLNNTIKHEHCKQWNKLLIIQAVAQKTVVMCVVSPPPPFFFLLLIFVCDVECL